MNSYQKLKAKIAELHSEIRTLVEDKETVRVLEIKFKYQHQIELEKHLLLTVKK